MNFTVNSNSSTLKKKRKNAIGYEFLQHDSFFRFNFSFDSLMMMSWIAEVFTNLLRRWWLWPPNKFFVKTNDHATAVFQSGLWCGRKCLFLENLLIFINMCPNSILVMKVALMRENKCRQLVPLKKASFKAYKNLIKFIFKMEAIQLWHKVLRDITDWLWCWFHSINISFLMKWWEIKCAFFSVVEFTFAICHARSEFKHSDRFSTRKDCIPKIKENMLNSLMFLSNWKQGMHTFLLTKTFVKSLSH